MTQGNFLAAVHTLIIWATVRHSIGHFLQKTWLNLSLRTVVILASDATHKLIKQHSLAITVYEAVVFVRSARTPDQEYARRGGTLTKNNLPANPLHQRRVQVSPSASRRARLKISDGTPYNRIPSLSPLRTRAGRTPFPQVDCVRR